MTFWSVLFPSQIIDLILIPEGTPLQNLCNCPNSVFREAFETTRIRSLKWLRELHGAENKKGFVCWLRLVYELVYNLLIKKMLTKSCIVAFRLKRKQTASNSSSFFPCENTVSPLWNWNSTRWRNLSWFYVP